MRLLACGGRDYTDWITVYRVLDALESVHVLIEGGALGADRLAREWANSRLIPVITFAADWKSHGKAAGPMRNQRMLEVGKPDLVVAFRGGKGTADMVSRAKAAGIEVRQITERPAEAGGIAVSRRGGPEAQRWL